MKRITKILAALMLTVAVIFATGCKKEQPEPEPNNNGNGEEPELTSSVYLGIVGYNGTLAVKEFALLDESSVDDFEAFIDNLMTSNGSALYYSDYEALKMLQTSNEPPQLNNVSLVTLTAGLDNLSLASEITNPEGYATKDEYLTALHHSIVTNSIHGKNINAYTLGLLTNEAQSNLDEFRTNLEMLASKEANVYEVENMEQANDSLDKIARIINYKTGSQNSSLIVLVLDNRIEMKKAAKWFIRKVQQPSDDPIDPDDPDNPDDPDDPDPNDPDDPDDPDPDDPDPTQLPIVMTSTVTDITTTSAIGGGNVIDDGGATVTERGICWSTSSNPTISNHHANNGTGTGSYSVTITDLSPNTCYYVRAFAINSEGISYGEDVVFVTEDDDYPVGAVKGEFSVAEGSKVYFSNGNLQYQASTDTWRFAAHQYDTIGSANVSISPNYGGWIDLFGWGTGNNPTLDDPHWEVYNAFHDWGDNAISNGGNTPNTWRTMTKEEWEYLLYTRSTASDIRFAVAQVNGVNGMIILPDDWSSSYYSLNDVNVMQGIFAGSVISESDWTNYLESKGAVFLPNSGWRETSYWVYPTEPHHIFNNGNETGHYWSSSDYDGERAWGLSTYIMVINNSSMMALGTEHILVKDGHAVRLVKDVR